MRPIDTHTDSQCCFSSVELFRGPAIFFFVENTMRYLSFFAVAVLATAAIAVSGCSGTETATNESSTSSTAPAAAQGLTEVSFDVKGMS